MKKKDILVIGCGQAGGNFVDELMNLDARYNGLFINTSARDIKHLKKANLNRNVYLIPNVDGSGRDRKLAVSYVKDNALAMIETIAGYIQQTEIILVSSMGGGSGSSIVPAILRLGKKRLPNKNFHVVAIKPSLDEQTDVLENTVNYWNDVMGAIDNFSTFSIVDNDKRVDKMDLNKEWAKLFDSSLNIANGSIEGSIDDADLKVISVEPGYKVIYRLDSDRRMEESVAVGKAINESIFFEAASDRCAYLGISTVKGDYKQDTLKEKFRYSKSVFLGDNTDENIIVASGCAIPKDAIELILAEIEDRKKEVVEVVFDKSALQVKVEKKKVEKKVNEIVEIKDTTNEDVIDDDDDFWGDAF